jgi:ElaA protein
MAEPVLRCATFEQLSAIELYRLLQLRCEVFIVEQGSPYPDVDGRDTEPGTRHLWIQEGERVLSALRVLQDGGDRSIGRVVTGQPARGRGLSGRLVHEAVGLCAGHPIHIGAQTYLEGWYARFGFVRTGPDYDEDGVMHLPMRRDAPSASGAPAAGWRP